MDLPNRKVLIKVFVTSQFSFCRLILMLHSRALNNHINNILEWALEPTYKDNQSSFKELSFCGSSSQKLTILVTEIFKVKNDLGPTS